MPKLLHVGCGPKGRPVPPAWADYAEVRVDMDATVAPDYVASLLALPFAAEYADALYCCHVLEHVERWEVDQALGEMWRVLVPGAQAVIIVPDLCGWAQMILDDPAGVEDLHEIPYSGNVTPLDALYGYEPDILAGHVGMRHKTMFTQTTLAKHLQRAGFSGRITAGSLQLYAIVTKDDQP